MSVRDSGAGGATSSTGFTPWMASVKLKPRSPIHTYPTNAAATRASTSSRTSPASASPDDDACPSTTPTVAPRFDAQKPCPSAVTPPAGLRAATMESTAHVSTLNVCAPTASACWATVPNSAVCADDIRKPNTTSSADTWNSASSRRVLRVRAHHAATASSAAPGTAVAHHAPASAPNSMDKPKPTSNRNMHTNRRLNGPGNEPGFVTASSPGPEASDARDLATGPVVTASAAMGSSA